MLPIIWIFCLYYCYSQTLTKIPIHIVNSIHSGSIFLDKLVTDSSFLDHILFFDANAVITQEYINAFQQLPEAIVRIALKNDLETFKKIFGRKNLVNWNIEKANHYYDAMNYRQSLLHAGDIADIAHVLLRPPPMNAVLYNPLISKEILDYLVSYILSQVHHLNPEILRGDQESKAEKIVSRLIKYLAFYGRENDLSQLLLVLYEHEMQVGFDLPLLLALQKGHLNVLKRMLDDDIFSLSIYDAIFEFCSSSGNMKCLAMLVNDEFLLKQKKSFDRELIFGMFHRHEEVLNLFAQNPFIQSKIPRDLLKQCQSIINADEESFTKFMILFLKDKPLSQLLNVAADGNDDSFIKFVLTNLDSTGALRVKAASDCAFFDNVPILDFVLTLKQDYTGSNSKTKQKNIKQKISSNTILKQVIPEVMDKASIHNHVSVLKHIYQLFGKKNDVINLLDFVGNGILLALKNGNVEAFQFYMEHFHNQFDMIWLITRFLEDHPVPFSARMFTNVFQHPQVHTIFPEIMYSLHIDDLFLKVAQEDLCSLQLIMNNYYTAKLIQKPALSKLLEHGFRKENAALVGFLIRQPLFMDAFSVPEYLQISKRIEANFKLPRYGYKILTRLISDPEFLDDTLIPTHDAFSLDQMNAYQHIPEALIQFAKIKDLESFLKILNRKDLVNWGLEKYHNPRRPLDYSKYLMHPGDILELSLEFIKQPPIDSRYYSKYDKEYTDAFVDFLLQHSTQFDPFPGSKMNDAMSCLWNYLTYYGRVDDFNHLIKSIRIKIPRYFPIFDTFYAFKNGHSEFIQMISNLEYLTEETYKRMFIYSCVFGNLVGLNSLLELKDFMEIKSNFHIELLVIAYHQWDVLFERMQQNKHVLDKITNSEWAKFKDIISSDAQTHSQKILDLVNQSQEEWILPISNARDTDFVKFCIENVKFKDDATKTDIIKGVSRHAALSGNFEMINYLLPKYSSFCHSPMIQTAMFGNQEEILEHLIEYKQIPRDKQMDLTLTVCIYNYQFDIIDVYMKYHQNQVSPIWSVNILLHSGKILLPTRYMVKLLDEKPVNAKVPYLPQLFSDPDLLLEIAERDLLSFQFLIMNYYTRDWVKKPLVEALVDTSVQTSNDALLQFTLSEPFLFNQLTPQEWLAMEHKAFALKGSGIKKVFKKYVNGMYRLHSQSLSIKKL